VTDRDAFDATDTSFDLPASSSASTRAAYSPSEPPAVVERDSASGLRGRLELRQDAPASGGNGLSNAARGDAGSSLAAQLESAMAAVDKVDILRDDPNFLEVDYSRTEVSYGAGPRGDARGLSGADEKKQDTSGSPGGLHGRSLEIGDDEEDELEKQMLKVVPLPPVILCRSNIPLAQYLWQFHLSRRGDGHLCLVPVGTVSQESRRLCQGHDQVACRSWK
jgi:hypothetical protein